MQIPNLTCTAPEVDSAPAKTRKRSKRRTRARLYIALAERHLEHGDDPGLVAALVRAAWAEHQKADAATRESRPAKPTLA